MQHTRSVGEIWLIDRVTSRQVRLPIETEPVTDLSLRPDGRRLLYSAGNPRPTLWMVSGLLGSR